MARLARNPTLACLSLAALTACGPKIRLSDNIDTQFDLHPSQRYDDRLHGPYVAGSSLEIYAYDTTEDNALDGWTMVSLDPDVLEVVSVEIIRDDLDDEDKRKVETDIIVAHVEATGPGTAILEVHNHNGKFVRATEVVVMQPDRAELRAAGPLFIGREDEVPSLVDATPKLLANGKATFLVEWFAGEQALHGTGSLAVVSDHPNAQNLWTLEEHLDEAREWAQIEFSSPEPGEELANIELYANGELVHDLEFEIVQPDAIADVQIVGRDESGDEGQLLAVLAQAFDATGESIWGVSFDWDIDGFGEFGEGDLFRYWYEPGISSLLGAEYGEARGEIMIQGDHGFVDSSNDSPQDGSCFCSSTGDEGPGRGVGFGLLSLAALGLVRRRRASA
jgi:MYXO-CTERM domain-containing protein